MKTEYNLGKIRYCSIRERDVQDVKVSVHCRFGQFNYLISVDPMVARSEQGEEMIRRRAMEAWRKAYEEKRQSERI